MTKKIAGAKAVDVTIGTTHFVLDTNVLLHNADSIKNFGNNTVVIPMKVLSELDTFKDGKDPIHYNARDVVRFIDDLRDQNYPSSLKNGVPRKDGGFLRIINEREFVTDYPALDMNDPDNKIISVAYQLMKEGKEVVFVSKDINARLRADFLGIPVKDFERQTVIPENLFSGQQALYVSRELVDEVYKTGSIDLPAGGFFMPNEFVVLADEGNPKHTAITRVMGGKRLVNIGSDNQNAFGVTSRNKEQLMTLDLLLDPRISFVTLIGPAGTGKTILAVAAALQQVKILQKYEKMVYSRAIIPMGKDIGYLPGTKDEKIGPWMEAFMDSLAIICAGKNNGGYDSSLTVTALMTSGLIELAALTYIRGRSIPKQFVIVDEVQNLTPHEVKTIASRAGEGTKIVFMGDPNQIDNPYLDKRSNGLVYAVDCMQADELHGHVTLIETVRSPLAQAIVNRMK